jgi:hypothetical protein
MSEGKFERRETDPAKLAEQLEIELMLKRASWQQAKARRGSLRAMSFMFLFLIIVGALFGFWFLFSPENVEEMKATAAQQRLHASPSPAVSPK